MILLTETLGVCIHDLRPGDTVKVGDESTKVIAVRKYRDCVRHSGRLCGSTVVVWGFKQRGMPVATVACTGDRWQRYRVIERGPVCTG